MGEINFFFFFRVVMTAISPLKKGNEEGCYTWKCEFCGFENKGLFSSPSGQNEIFSHHFIRN